MEAQKTNEDWESEFEKLKYRGVVDYPSAVGFIRLREEAHKKEMEKARERTRLAESYISGEYVNEYYTKAEALTPTKEVTEELPTNH